MEINMEQSSATEKLKIELNKFKVLYELALNMSSDRSLEENLAYIVEQGRQILGADTAYMALADEGKNEVYMHSLSGIRTEAFKKMRLPYGKGLGGKVMATRKGYIIHDYFHDTEITHIVDSIVKEEGLVSGMAVPIRFGSLNLGVLYIFNRRYTDFTQDNLDTLLLLGNLAAVEISRRMTESELRRAHDELEIRVEKRTKELSEINKELQESEGRYRSIFENAIEGIFQSSPQGRFIDVNPAMAAMCGFSSPREMIESISDIASQYYINPEDRERFMRFMSEQGHAENIQYQVYRKDGSKIWMSVNARAVKDAEGRLSYYEGMTQDITLYKEYEQALQKSEERYRVILEEIEDGYQEVDLKGNFTFCNKSFQKMFGYEKNELLGTNFKNYAADEENARRIYLAYNKMFKTGNPIKRYEWDIIAGDGSRKTIEFSASILKNAEGCPTGFRGIVRDVTERRMAEDQYRIVANSSQVGVYIVQDGRIRFANPHISKYSGYPENELLGARMLHFVHPDDRDHVRKMAKKMLNGETVTPYEFRIVGKDGNVKWLMETVTSIVYDGKRAVLGSTMDITKQKEVEAERHRLESELLQAKKMEAIGTLAGGIAHDFNNLLMGIEGYASLILLHIDSAHPHYEKLRAIQEQAHSGSNLTRQLLGFAKGGQYELRPANLNELLRRIISIFSRTKKEVNIHEKYLDGLWTAELDRGQIEQVMLNLLLNAWQAMPNQMGDIYVETQNVTLDESFTHPYGIKAGGYVKISIRDTGIGMDEQTRQRVFDPFFTTKEMGRGTGLGLASSYGIIKSHGGIINLESEKGKGTTFYIYLPQSGKNEIKFEQEAFLGILKGSETILIIDDEKPILDVTRDLLEELGYRVISATGGQQAIQIYHANRDRIALVIFDMIMPGMDGGELFDALKSINPDVKAILASGYSIDGKAQMIINRGVQAFLQKPFRVDDLSKKIREILGKE